MVPLPSFKGSEVWARGFFRDAGHMRGPLFKGPY